MKILSKTEIMPPSSVQFAMNDESSRRRDSLDGTTPAKGATSIKPIPVGLNCLNYLTFFAL